MGASSALNSAALWWLVSVAALAAVGGCMAGCAWCGNWVRRRRWQARQRATVRALEGFAEVEMSELPLLFAAET